MKPNLTYGKHIGLALLLAALVVPLDSFGQFRPGTGGPGGFSGFGGSGGRGGSSSSRTYPGAGHAFFNDTRPEAYRPAAAADAWARAVAFLHRHLG